MRNEIEKLIKYLRRDDSWASDIAIADRLQAILDADPVKCSTCHGTGWVPSAFFPDGRGCEKCGGAGTVEADDAR